MVEHLKQEETLHSSSDLLKIFVKIEKSWSAQDFRQSSGAFLVFCFQKTWHTSTSQIESAGGRERGVARGVDECMEGSEQVQGVRPCFSNLQ